MFLSFFFLFFFFFFFSSRRRHTRCSRDWSSDVCSSDLEPAPLTGCPAANLATTHRFTSEARHHGAGSAPEWPVALSGQPHASVQGERVRFGENRVLQSPRNDGRGRHAVGQVLRKYPGPGTNVGFAHGPVAGAESGARDPLRRVPGLFAARAGSGTRTSCGPAGYRFPLPPAP